MSNARRLAEYRDGPEALKKRLAAFSQGELDYQPSWPGAWTVREHVIHLVDSDVNGFVRIKSILAQPGSVCFVMDEDAWTQNLKGKREDLDAYLRLFSLLRGLIHDLVKDEPEAAWNGNYYTRTYLGKTENITLSKAIDAYCAHLSFHLEYLDRIEAELRPEARGKA
jgi:hypothetical protein